MIYLQYISFCLNYEALLSLQMPSSITLVANSNSSNNKQPTILPTSKPSQPSLYLPPPHLQKPKHQQAIRQICYSGHLSYSVSHKCWGRLCKKSNIAIAFPPLFFPSCINWVRTREKPSALKSPQIPPWLHRSSGATGAAQASQEFLIGFHESHVTSVSHFQWWNW